MIRLFSALPMFKRLSILQYQASCTQLANTVRKVSTNVTPSKPIHEVNTNVLKDVILFKYENPKFFRIMNLFALVQYMFWTYLGIFSYNSLRDAPVDKTTVSEDSAWYRKINLGENKYKNTLAAIAVIVGSGSLSMIWMYTLRSVRFLILNKGGKHLTFVTYTPFGQNRIMKVPIEFVCCKESRKNAKVQLPLKIKNKWMHYMLDMRGEFKNPIMFDSTAGLFRKI